MELAELLECADECFSANLGAGVVQAVLLPILFSLLAFWDHHVYAGTPDSGPQASEALFGFLYSLLVFILLNGCQLFSIFKSLVFSLAS